MGTRRPRPQRPWEAAPAPRWPREGAPGPGRGARGSGRAAPLGPGDAEDAPADDGDLPRGSLTEVLPAGLRYPEPCLLLFPSFCISLFPDEAARVTARQGASSVRCRAFSCSVLLVSATVH